jgi:hypothetical protein
MTVVKEEVPLESSNKSEFGINNPKTWNKDNISHIGNHLRVNEIPADGLQPGHGGDSFVWRRY